MTPRLAIVLAWSAPWLVGSFSPIALLTANPLTKGTSKRPIKSVLCAVGGGNTNTWRSAISNPAEKPDAIDAVRDLCTSTPCRSPDVSQGEKGLAFLFVSQKYADSIPDIVETAHEILGEDTTLLSVVGGGVVGGGVESDDPTVPAMSLLCGVLPSSAGVEVFMFGPDEAPPPASSKAWKAIGRNQDVPSYIVFADPWSPIQKILDGLDSCGVNGAVVAGGISVPTFGDEGPTVAINGKAYPRGTAVGVGLSGTVGLQAVVAQGCRAVGPAFGVTEADGNMIVELEGKPATEILSTITTNYLSDEDTALVETSGLLCGLAAPGMSSVTDGDYLVRQIMGFRVPAIMIGAEVRQGDILRFHVRDATAARGDMQNMIGRAKTERMFTGSENAGVPLAALQVSCVARGRALFGSPNFDLESVKNLLGVQEPDHAAVGGFFANGEIGPVGIAGVGINAKQTHMHGFTTVAATICDFRSADSTPSSTDTRTSDMRGEDDLSAWE
mmetsp:Transcript_22798/g.47355  ORF Transcript_22798/g.47355 Transcript_22798/m.47355 type:complete len:499 (-) Transcript_22798:896-2392(-)